MIRTEVMQPPGLDWAAYCRDPILQPALLWNHQPLLPLAWKEQAVIVHQLGQMAHPPPPHPHSVQQRGHFWGQTLLQRVLPPLLMPCWADVHGLHHPDWTACCLDELGPWAGLGQPAQELRNPVLQAALHSEEPRWPDEQQLLQTHLLALQGLAQVTSLLA